MYEQQGLNSCYFLAPRAEAATRKFFQKKIIIPRSHCSKNDS